MKWIFKTCERSVMWTLGNASMPWIDFRKLQNK